jgi:DnaK suppressor protein
MKSKPSKKTTSVKPAPRGKPPAKPAAVKTPPAKAAPAKGAAPKPAPAKAAAGKTADAKVAPPAKGAPVAKGAGLSTNNKTSPTPGKSSNPMPTRKPEPGKTGKPGAAVPPSKPANRRDLIRAPVPRAPEKPELPKLKKSPYGKADLKPMKAALLELRSRLQGAIDKLGNEALRADEPDTDSEDVADHGSDAFERNMTLGLMENEARTLHQIEDALEQMEGGRYGVCILCGQGIPLARLEALPFATTCVPCQEKAERRL